MPAPYDYTIGDIASPQQSFLQGIQMVDFMRKREQDQAAAFEAKRKEEELQSLYAEAMKPDAKPEVFERLSFAIDPKQAALSRMQQLSSAQQDAIVSNIGSVWTPLVAGKQDLAIQRADELIKAMENSPNVDPKALQALKASRQALGQSPELAQVSLATTLMGFGDKGRKFVTDTFEALKKPVEQREAVAKASKAEREATGEPSDQFEILSNKQASSFGLPPGTYQRDKTTGKITSIGSGGVTVNMPPQVQVGTIPQGYKLTYDQQGRPLSMEPIPGSQAARDVAAEAEKAASSAASTVTSSNIVLSEATRLKNLIKKESFFKPVTGVGGAIVREKGGVLAAGTPALTAQKTIDTIKANIGFDRLTQMRKESPTGGALGNITEKELAFLQSVLGSLDINQDKKILLENIDRVEETYKSILRKASAYPNAAKYGFDDVTATSKSKPPASDAQPANRNIRVDY